MSPLVWKVVFVYLALDVLNCVAEIDHGHANRLEHRNPFLTKMTRPMTNRKLANQNIHPESAVKSMERSVDRFHSHEKFKHEQLQSHPLRKKPIYTTRYISHEIAHNVQRINPNFPHHGRQKRSSTKLDLNEILVAGILSKVLNETEKKLDEFSNQLMYLQEATSETNRQLKRNFLPRLKTLENRLDIQTSRQKPIHCTGKREELSSQFNGLSRGFVRDRNQLQNELTERVKILAYCKLPMNETYGENNQTLLHIAAEIDAAETAWLLIGNGVVIGARQAEGKTPLHLAAKNNSVYILSLLIDNGANISAVDSMERTALFDAAETDAAEAAQILLENQANINTSDKDGKQPIHIAARSNSPNVLKLLIDHGASVNINDGAGTPLEAAANTDAVDAAKVLLDNGADITLSNFFGDGLLHFAARANATKVISLFIQYKVPIENQNRLGYTALHWAAHKNALAAAQVLVDNGANIHSQTIVNTTPLHTAAQHNSLGVLKFLLDKGANVHHTDTSNQTAYQIARRVSCYECMEILEKYGARE